MSILWAKFLGWCKRQWKLILGFFAGVLAIFAIMRGGLKKKTLEKKNESQDKIRESEQKARVQLEKEYQQNLESFLDRSDKIESKEKEKILALDGDKKKRVKAYQTLKKRI